MARWDQPREEEVPEWFWRAVDTPSREHGTLVDDCEVAYRTWGDPEKPPLLLVHGMMAHSRWWDFIAPQLADEWYPVAIDLGGMGDSDFRYEYSATGYAEEIKAVCDAAHLGQEVILVAHSFGGVVSVKAVNRFQDRFAGLVLVDSGIRPADDPPPERPGFGGSQVYPDRASAEARFRVQPPQEVRAAFTVRHIASQSLMPVDGGWAWKFDSDILTELSGAELGEAEFRALTLPVALIYGKQSAHCSQRMVDYMRELIPDPFSAHGIEDAGHHVFLDQPLEFVRELRDVIPRHIHEPRGKA